MSNIFLTFDMDWANDGVLDDFLKLIKDNHLTGTLNVTHQTDVLDGKENSLELGIHPNYNRLLMGDSTDKNYLNVLKNIKEIVPDAITMRSHALASSSVIVSSYKQFGIQYDLNTLIPAYNGLCVKPYASPINPDVLVLPFIFEDDIYLSQVGRGKSPEFFLCDEFEAPRIFNFHPIHLFLNTDKISTYENARPYFKDYEMLKMCVNRENYGIRDFFFELISAAKTDGWTFKKICEGDWK